MPRDRADGRGHRLGRGSSASTTSSSRCSRRRPCGSTGRSPSGWRAGRRPGSTRSRTSPTTRCVPAVRADLLRRLGRTDEAADAYREALTRTTNQAERAYLERRLRAEAGTVAGWDRGVTWSRWSCSTTPCRGSHERQQRDAARRARRDGAAPAAVAEPPARRRGRVVVGRRGAAAVLVAALVVTQAVARRAGAGGPGAARRDAGGRAARRRGRRRAVAARTPRRGGPPAGHRRRRRGRRAGRRRRRLAGVRRPRPAHRRSSGSGPRCSGRTPPARGRWTGSAAGTCVAVPGRRRRRPTQAACLVSDGFVQYGDEGVETRKPATTTRVVVLDTARRARRRRHVRARARRRSRRCPGSRSWPSRADGHTEVTGRDLLTGEVRWRFSPPRPGADRRAFAGEVRLFAVDGLVGVTVPGWTATRALVVGRGAARQPARGRRPRGRPRRRPARPALHHAGPAPCSPRWCSGAARTSTLPGEVLPFTVDDGSVPDLVLTSDGYAARLGRGHRRGALEVRRRRVRERAGPGRTGVREHAGRGRRARRAHRRGALAGRDRRRAPCPGSSPRTGGTWWSPTSRSSAARQRARRLRPRRRAHRVARPVPRRPAVQRRRRAPAARVGRRRPARGPRADGGRVGSRVSDARGAACRRSSSLDGAADDEPAPAPAPHARTLALVGRRRGRRGGARARRDAVGRRRPRGRRRRPARRRPGRAPPARRRAAGACGASRAGRAPALWGGIDTGDGGRPASSSAADGSQSFTAVDQRTGETALVHARCWARTRSGRSRSSTPTAAACRRGAPGGAAGDVRRVPGHRRLPARRRRRARRTRGRPTTTPGDGPRHQRRARARRVARRATAPQLAVLDGPRWSSATATRSAVVEVVAHDPLTGDERWRYAEPLVDDPTADRRRDAPITPGRSSPPATSLAFGNGGALTLLSADGRGGPGRPARREAATAASAPTP